mmetsp:Transcript_6814/g.13844  ORF Transcript_6814/g.13844 Transcript_6814/m.13844 type:complete len:336 (-) Transcript_6814:104-1111(-)
MQINRLLLSLSSLTGSTPLRNGGVVTRDQHHQQQQPTARPLDSFVETSSNHNMIPQNSLLSSSTTTPKSNNNNKPSDYLETETPALQSSTYLQAMKHRSRQFSVPRLAMLFAATLAPESTTTTTSSTVVLPRPRQDQSSFASPPPPAVAVTEYDNNSATTQFHNAATIAKGLTKVINALPAQLFQLWHERVPQPLRFFISGNCGNVCFYVCELAFSRMLASSSHMVAWISHDSITFLGGYLAHIVAQHWLHAALVYGLDTINTPQKYFTTLRGMYQAMMTSAVGSTLLNTLLLRFLPVLSKPAAFILTLWTFSAINYFWIGWIVKRSSESQQTVA